MTIVTAERELDIPTREYDYVTVRASGGKQKTSKNLRKQILGRKSP